MALRRATAEIQVRVILDGSETSHTFSDVTDLDAATISDTDLKNAVANWMDIEVERLSNHKVLRPETGNILLMEQEFRYG